MARRGRQDRGRAPRVQRGGYGPQVARPEFERRNRYEVARLKRQVAPVIGDRILTPGRNVPNERPTPREDAPDVGRGAAARDAAKEQGRAKVTAVSSLDLEERDDARKNCKRRPDSRVNRGKGTGRPFVPYCSKGK